MARRRGSDAGQSRRKWVRSCRGCLQTLSPSILSCIGRRQKKAVAVAAKLGHWDSSQGEAGNVNASTLHRDGAVPAPLPRRWAEIARQISRGVRPSGPFLIVYNIRSFIEPVQATGVRTYSSAGRANAIAHAKGVNTMAIINNHPPSRNIGHPIVVLRWPIIVSERIDKACNPSKRVHVVGVDIGDWMFWGRKILILPKS